MHTRPFVLHALSPLHAGTGHAADIIDLPIARMKATGIPIVPGSSIKGVLRDARGPGDHTDAVFGPLKSSSNPPPAPPSAPPRDPPDHAGALVVGDARLLALPVRSFRGTFAWATSPLLLLLATRDLEARLPVPAFPGRGARVAPASACVHNRRLYLDDLDLPAEESPEVARWALLLAPLASPGEDIFTKRLVVVDDETMTFLWQTATQVDARVRLSQETRTVASGALWLEESLPPETLLLGLLAADRTRGAVPLLPDAVLGFALPGEQILQFGGKATVGRGRCRMVPVPQKLEAARGAA